MQSIATPLATPAERRRTSVLAPAGALALVALALALRLVNAAEWSLWADEANVVRRVRLPLEQLLVTLASADTHPPLYYLLVRAWLGAFGEAEASLRAFSVLWGLAALPLVAVLARRLAGRTAMWVGVSLAAVSPALVLFAHEGRPYTLLAFLGLANFAALRRATARGRREDWAVYSLLTALSLYTHNLAFLWLAWQVVVVAVDGERRALPARARQLAVAQAGAYLLYLPWGVLFVGQLTRFAHGGEWLLPPEPLHLLLTLMNFVGGASALRVGGLQPTLSPTHALLLSCPVLLVYAGARRLPGRDRWSLLAFTLLPVATLFLVAQVVAVYVERALLPSVLGLALLSAAAFRPPLSRATALLLGAALLGGLALSLSSLATAYGKPRDEYRELVADLEAAIRPGESVVFLPGFGSVAFSYYWDHPAEPHPLVELEAVDQLQDGDLRRLTYGGRAVWIVRVPAPPPEAGLLLPEQLEGVGLQRAGIRYYPDPLLTLELYVTDPSDTRGLAWRPDAAPVVRPPSGWESRNGKRP